MSPAGPWRLVFTSQAQKDARKLAHSGLREKGEEILEILRSGPPRFETLVGDLAGACSRRINVQHRLVYQVLDEQRAVKVIRMWTHYE